MEINKVGLDVRVSPAFGETMALLVEAVHAVAQPYSRTVMS
jgi:hypothetical protein